MTTRSDPAPDYGPDDKGKADAKAEASVKRPETDQPTDETSQLAEDLAKARDLLDAEMSVREDVVKEAKVGIDQRQTPDDDEVDELMSDLRDDITE